MAAPMVSVLMACRNAEPWLEEALASALDQDYAQLEVVAIDDASDDATAEVLKRVASAYPGRVRVYCNRARIGVATTRTRCLEVAEGDLICVLDADDVWLPGKITRQVAAFEGRREVGVVHTAFEAFDDQTGEIIEWERPATLQTGGDVLRELWVRGNFVAASSMMVRRSTLTTRRLAFSDLGFAGYDDYFLLLSLALEQPFAYIEDVLVRYRRHMASLTAPWVDENIHAHRVAALRAYASQFPDLRNQLGSAFGYGLARHSLDAAAYELSHGRWRQALAYTATAARFDPVATADALCSYVAGRFIPRSGR